MNEIIGILLVTGLVAIYVAAVAIGWRYFRTKHPSRRQKIAPVVIFVLAIGAVIGFTAAFWPKPTTTLSSADSAALQKTYNLVTSGIPMFYDPLQQQDTNNWNVGTWDKGDNCGFRGGAYHVKSVEQEYYAWCIAEVPNFNNFAFQVQMNILSGDGGGIVFRADGRNGNYYYFRVGQDGSYGFYRYAHKSDKQELQSGSSASIKTGQNQTNLLCVVARGSHFYLFVNKQPVAEINDGTYRAGQIGLAADEDTKTTDVAYSNVEVWTL